MSLKEEYSARGSATSSLLEENHPDSDPDDPMPMNVQQEKAVNVVFIYDGHNKTATSVENGETTDTDTRKKSIDESSDPTENETPKRNAFELMMNSRHSVIGRNSPGREVSTEVDVPNVEKKSALSARKKRLENWSEAKGGSKRKREYEETGKTIEHKLEKRSKRMKKLLKVQADDVEEEEVFKITRKRRTVIKSDTDTDEDDDDDDDTDKTPKKVTKKKTHTIKTRRPPITEHLPTRIIKPNTLIEAWKWQIAYKMDEQQEREEESGEVSDIDNFSEVKVERNSAEEFEIDIVEEKLPDIEVKEEKRARGRPKKSLIKVEPETEIMETLEKQLESVGNVEHDSADEFAVDVNTQRAPQVEVKSEKRGRGRPRKSTIKPQDKEILEEKQKIGKKLDFKNGEKANLKIDIKKEKSTEIGVTKEKRGRGRPRKSPIKPPDEVSKDMGEKCVKIAEGNESESTDVQMSDLTMDKLEVIEPGENANNKRSLRLRRSKIPVVFDSSDEDDDEEVAKGPKEIDVPIKLAPIFLKKSTPKPKLDPKVSEARREFLLSGKPESFKKERTNQERLEDVEYDVFPVISHVQQKTDSEFWNLPNVDLELLPLAPFLPENHSFKLQKTVILKNDDEINVAKVVDEKSRITLVKDIKDKNPDYPVFKVFKNLREKSGYCDKQPEVTRKRGRPRKSDQKTPEMLEGKSVEKSAICNVMWTEKYKPQSSLDIFGNRKSVELLKKWLEDWSIKKSVDDNSESDFAISGDSRDSGTCKNRNTTVISGPSGSGKSAAIYAICNELNFQVLEINASSKRTGKMLLSQVQEATQSHQVKNKKNIENGCKNRKMCVILVEDVDLVFDQDDGFISALSQIISTSKRPIILTTNDETCSISQKFMNQNQIITFSPLSPKILDVWLQVLCLLEGVFVEKEIIDEIMTVFHGDVRKILQHLQFWATTDKDGNSSNIKKNLRKKINKDLTLFWWNLPRLLNLEDYSENRLKNLDLKDNDVEKIISEKELLQSVFKVYDTLSICDSLHGKKFKILNIKSGRYFDGLKDGLSLQQPSNFYKDQTISDDLSNFLLTSSLNSYNEKITVDLDPTLPNHEEMKWLSKRKLGEDSLQHQVLQLVNYLDLQSIYLDYMPTLRLMARSESERASHNTKRNNRFFNYLSNFGIRSENVNCKLACGVFRRKLHS